MEMITKEEVNLRGASRNNYTAVGQKVRAILAKGKVDVKSTWTIEEDEGSMYSTLGSAKRKHVSAKYGLAVEIGRKLTGIFKQHIHCKFTQAAHAFYISNEAF